MASTSFRHLIRKPISAIAHWHLVRDFEKMSDQAAVLISCSFLDRALERSIRSRMSKLPKKYHREIFLGTGPLGTLWAKTRIAYSLAIIGPNGFAELEKLREIRNVFAHAAHPIKFTTPRIAAHCKTLRLGNSQKLPPAIEKLYEPAFKLSSKNPRDMFLRSAMMLYFLLDNTHYKEVRPKRDRDIYTTRYL